MRIPEGFGDERLVDSITMTESLPKKTVRELRRGARVEQDWLYTGLEFLSQGLEIEQGPKLFYKEDYINYARTTILTVPLGHIGIHQRPIFVAINTETSHPELDDTRQLRATAYKFDAIAKQICQYPEHLATRSKHGNDWQHNPHFGPFIHESNQFVSVTCWHENSLQLPTETYDKISPEAIMQRTLARDLVGLLGSLTLEDQKNFSLFPRKL